MNDLSRGWLKQELNKVREVGATLPHWLRGLPPMTPEEEREQLISLAYGNLKLSNPDLTKDQVRKALDEVGILNRITKPIITLDVDGTTLDTGRGLVPRVNRTYEYFERANKGEFPGAAALCQKYRVYFLSSRSFPGALDLTYKQVGALPCEGIITGVDYRNKETISKALGAIAHIDDDWRITQTESGWGHTIFVNVWEDCPAHVFEENHVFTRLDDPQLLRVLQARWKLITNTDS